MRLIHIARFAHFQYSIVHRTVNTGFWLHALSTIRCIHSAHIFFPISALSLFQFHTIELRHTIFVLLTILFVRFRFSFNLNQKSVGVISATSKKKISLVDDIASYTRIHNVHINKYILCKQIRIDWTKGMSYFFFSTVFTWIVHK